MTDATGLVGDIGRQSVRFGLIGGTIGVEPRLVRSYPVDAHSTFTSALVAYLDDTGHRDARLPAMLALSGVVRGDVANITNSRWFISLGGVSGILRAPAQAMNDFAACAFALTTLGASEFTSLPGPVARPPRGGGCYLVIGPGTGLGVAGLFDPGTGLVPVQSEAGHLRLAAETEDERRFAVHAARTGERFVSAETLLSANGLAMAHAVLSGRTLPPLRPEDVTRAHRTDPYAAAAIDLFVDHLSAVIGDLVLAFGAWDGVFLTGPIVKVLRERLMRPGFRRRMEAHGSYARRLHDVPVAIVQHGDLNLRGAAAALAAMQARGSMSATPFARTPDPLSARA